MGCITDASFTVGSTTPFKNNPSGPPREVNTDGRNQNPLDIGVNYSTFVKEDLFKHHSFSRTSCGFAAEDCRLGYSFFSCSGVLLPLCFELVINYLL